MKMANEGNMLPMPWTRISDHYQLLSGSFGQEGTQEGGKGPRLLAAGALHFPRTTQCRRAKKRGICAFWVRYAHVHVSPGFACSTLWSSPSLCSSRIHSSWSWACGWDPWEGIMGSRGQVQSSEFKMEGAISQAPNGSTVSAPGLSVYLPTE